jgi:hypothetical protein
VAILPQTAMRAIPNKTIGQKINPVKMQSGISGSFRRKGKNAQSRQNRSLRIIPYGISGILISNGISGHAANTCNAIWARVHSDPHGHIGAVPGKTSSVL